MPSNPGNGKFQAMTDVFWKWVQQRPGTTISPKIRIADLRNHGQGRGVVAVRDVREDEGLFTIALSDVLMMENSSIYHIKQQELDRLQTWDALVLTMIYEHGKGEDSAWWPYLNVLPTNFDTLVYWSPSELAELQGSAVVGKVGKHEADEHFNNTLLPIVQRDPTIFGHYSKAFIGAHAEASFVRICHRMATLIQAYSFDLDVGPLSDEEDEDNEDEIVAGDLKKGMVPLADLLNADGDLNNAHLVRNEKSMTMTATTRIKAGQQIFNDFGDLPRSDLLRRYGYVTDNYKKWDVVELPLRLVCESTARYNPLSEEGKDKRLSLAEDWGVDEDGYDLSWPTEHSKFEIPTDLQLTMVALLLDEDHYEEEKAAKNRPRSTGLISRPMYLYLAFRDAIAQRLTMYATTIAQDTEMLQDRRLKRRQRMAVEVRLGEKEILATTLDATTKQIEEIEGEFKEECEDMEAMQSAKKRKT